MIYIDGMQFGAQPLISAVGVDVHGYKHVLGIQLGATEKAALAVKDLLTRLREQGLKTQQRYLFVIDDLKDLLAWRIVFDKRHRHHFPFAPACFRRFAQYAFIRTA